MNITFKRFLAFVLSFMIVFSSTSVLAASPAGWAVSDVAVTGASARITALKGTGSSALKSVISHTPTAVKIGKEILKGGGALGVAYALSQLVQAGVDWVLSPDNNTVKYKPVGGFGDGSIETDAKGKIYGYTLSTTRVVYPTTEAACQAFSDGRTCTGITISVPGESVCASRIEGMGYNKCFAYVTRVAPSAASRGIDPEGYKSVPLDTVADKIVSNAVAGHAPSQDVIKAAAIDMVDTGALDTELESSAVPNVGTTNPDGTVTNPDGTVTNPDGTVTNPDGTVANPSTPFDPSSIISAIKSLATTIGDKFTAMTNAIGITNGKLDDISIADAATAEAAKKAAAEAKSAAEAKAKRDAEFKDWATAEPTPLDPNTALDIDVPSVLPVDTDINFGGSCPANFEVNSSIFGNPINIVLLDSSKFCGFLSTFVKFPVYAVSSLFALYILGGRKDV